ncbi:MAG: hypothetical protein ACT4OK_10955 [Gemmobacter sp.]
MTFIVNGAEWDFNGMDAIDAERLIDRVLEFVYVSVDRGEEVLIGDEFQTRPMHGAFTLWDLFGEESPLHLRRELAQELTAWLLRAQRYADVHEWPIGMEDTMISVGGAPTTQNEDLAWVHYCLRSGIPTACVTLGANQVAATTTATGSVDVHFVGDDFGRKHFWRSAITLVGDSLNNLLRYASRAYPDLHFVGNVLSDADHLSGGYLASRHRLRSALAVLDDWGRWVFTHPPPTISPEDTGPVSSDARPSNQIIEHRFARFGLDAAPENPNVRGHRVSREARETELGGRTLYCEWHVKLEPHRNRIHFHAPVPESRGRVVVGMIHEHLPLPA